MTEKNSVGSIQNFENWNKKKTYIFTGCFVLGNLKNNFSTKPIQNSFFLHISCLPDTGDDGRPVFGRIALLKDKSGLVGEAAVSPMTTTSYGLK